MSKQNIYSARVDDVDDPMLLGRIRAIPENEDELSLLSKTKQECIDYNDDKTMKGIRESCKWTRDDPYMFLSLLPYYINVTPVNNEYVHIFYTSETSKFPNQFYLRGPLSSPMGLPYEHFENSKTFLADGRRNKVGLSLKKINKDNVQLPKTEFIEPRANGIFPEPGDNYILGRGTADVIVKKDEVLLRAGKYVGGLSPLTQPTGYDSRSFIQLSYFPSTRQVLDPIVALFLTKKIGMLKKLVEWNIENPENEANAFTGTIKLFNVKYNEDTTTESLLNDKTIDINNYLTNLPEYEIRFEAETFENVVYKINKYIQGVNDGLIDITPNPNLPIQPPSIVNNPQTNQLDPKYTFPFFFRPNISTYQWLEKQDTFPIQFSNVERFYESIKFKTETGAGLVFAKDKSGAGYDPKIEEQTQYTTLETPITYATIGGDKIYLITHKTSIPGMKPINLSNTLYGIDQPKFAEEIDFRTNSVIRGEKFVQIIKLLVRWAMSHVHSTAPTPPIPISLDSVDISMIDSMLADEQSYLNKNIRIN